MVLAKGKNTCTLYTMQAKLIREEVNVVDDSSFDLGHMRLGYLSEKRLGTFAT